MSAAMWRTASRRIDRARDAALGGAGDRELRDRSGEGHAAQVALLARGDSCRRFQRPDNLGAWQKQGALGRMEEHSLGSESGAK